MSRYWGKGSTRKWRALRLTILRRDNYICQLKLEGVCTYRADCVHHVKGKEFGDDPKYLVSACTPCNLKVGNPNSDHGSSASQDPEPRPCSLLD